jgi:hypothetical protein
MSKNINLNFKSGSKGCPSLSIIDTKSDVQVTAWPLPQFFEFHARNAQKDKC